MGGPAAAGAARWVALDVAAAGPSSLWIRLLSSSAPGEQLGVGAVELYHLAERQVAPLRQRGVDGARGRVGQGAVVDLLLGGGLEQTKALEGTEAGLDAGCSLVARGLRGRGGVDASELLGPSFGGWLAGSGPPDRCPAAGCSGRCRRGATVAGPCDEGNSTSPIGTGARGHAYQVVAADGGLPATSPTSPGCCRSGPASPPGRWLGATPILVMPSGSASSSGCGRPPSSSSATRSSKKRRRHSGLPAERTKGPSR
jgi:hypothetical protein